MIQLVVFYAMCHTFLFRIGMVVYVYIYIVYYIQKGKAAVWGDWMETLGVYSLGCGLCKL